MNPTSEVQAFHANVPRITPLFSLWPRISIPCVFADMNEESSIHYFEPLLNSEQAAQLLDVHEKTVIHWAREKKLPAMRLGKLWRFRATQLDAWLALQAQSCCQPTRA